MLHFGNMRLIYCTFVALVALTAVSHAQRLICYYRNNAQIRIANGRFEISNINATLCTDLIYAYAGIQDNGTVVSLNPTVDLPLGEPAGSQNGFGEFNNLRNQNSNLRTLLAIGGPTEGSAKYSRMAANSGTRGTFVQSAVALLRRYGFNGMSLDWQYPVQRGGAEEDKQNFVALLSELSVRFLREGLRLYVTVRSAEPFASSSYNIPEIARYVEYINLETYGLYDSSEERTAINAPLNPAPRQDGNADLLNVNAAVDYWIAQGAPADKLILGIPFFGRSFTLANVNNAGIDALASLGAPGPYTDEAGFLSYLEICEELRANNWNVVFDETRRVPYAVRGDQWISYDDIRSTSEKVAFLKQKGLAGASVFRIEDDDFIGSCGSRYPLLNNVRNALTAV